MSRSSGSDALGWLVGGLGGMSVGAGGAVAAAEGAVRVAASMLMPFRRMSWMNRSSKMWEVGDSFFADLGDDGSLSRRGGQRPGVAFRALHFGGIDALEDQLQIGRGHLELACVGRRGG